MILVLFISSLPIYMSFMFFYYNEIPFCFFNNTKTLCLCNVLSLPHTIDVLKHIKLACFFSFRKKKNYSVRVLHMPLNNALQ